MFFAFYTWVFSKTGAASLLIFFSGLSAVENRILTDF
jgi:hypothetical protein